MPNPSSVMPRHLFAAQVQCVNANAPPGASGNNRHAAVSKAGRGSQHSLKSAFCNKIGPKRKCQTALTISGYRGTLDENCAA